jgi:predicted acetyltransferase
LSGQPSLPVKISLVPAARKAVLRNLMQLYLYDFSEFEPADVDAWGRFRYGYLPHYWKEAGRYPFLIEAGGRPAGFALACDIAWPLDSPAHWMAEFFVLRSLRRRGVGQEAAWQVFRSLPGLWRVGQVAANTPAQAFWRKVITEFTGGEYRQQVLDGPNWHGPLQEFVSRGTEQ